MRLHAKVVLGAIVAVVVAGTVASFGLSARRTRPSTDAATTTAPTVTAAAPAPPPSATTPVSLVPWSGPIEHIFFHTLVAEPRLAFTHDKLAQGFRDYFVTVSEFKAILDQLYANGWTLVDIHRVSDGTVLVPVGRRPLVISEDDVNYYDYERPRGLGWKLVLDSNGQVKVEIHDSSGVRVTDEDLVPLIDEFVALHPDFSAQGAKGVLAVTGYQGLFGERIQNPTLPDYTDSVIRASAVADRLKATGWTLASHSYGHIDLTKTTTARAQSDLERWQAEADPIIGATDVYIYPFGARPPPATIQMLHAHGFNILCDIDTTARLLHVDGVTVMSRRHIDGLALRQQHKALAALFDTTTVQDVAARHG
jgi:hypothetical protein